MACPACTLEGWRLRLLLDTNVALWAFGQTRKLDSKTLERIADESNEVWVSTVSVWEVAIKTRSGRLRIDSMGFVEAARQMPFSMLDITAHHAMAVETLPQVHGDPFDRMLIAQASVEGLRIVTADYRFGEYDCDPIFV